MNADLYFEEATFQLVHLADLQQTLQTKHYPNLGESSSIIDAGWAIGRHPSDRSIYAFMGAEGLLHAGVTVLLAKYCPAWTSRVWEITTISVDGATVAHNAHLGLQVRF